MRFLLFRLSDTTFVISLTIVLLAYVTLAFPAALSGPYNPDEGWYLYDSLLTWHGQVPYRDFGFPQPPVVILVHGLFQILLGPGFYLGRIVNMIFGGIAIVITALAGKRLGGNTAGFISAGLLGFSPWFATQMTSVSTYALASILLSTIIFVAVKRQWYWAGAFSAIAIATRVQLAPLLIVLIAAIVLAEKHNRKQNLARALIGMAIAATLLIGPFIFLAGPGPTYTHIIGHHTYTRHDLITNEILSGNITHLWSVIRQYQNQVYLPLYGIMWLLALITPILVAILHPRSLAKKYYLIFLLLCTALLVAIGNVSFGTNRTHDIPILTLLALSSGWSIAILLQHTRSQLMRIGILLIFGFIVVRGIVLPQLPVYTGSGENEESHANIARVASYIRQHSTPSDEIFTPELHIALEADRSVSPGLELGRFFYFPELSDSEAKRRGGLNRHLTEQTIRNRLPKYIVLNENHYWQNYPKNDEEQYFEPFILLLGYRQVEELNTYQPTVQQLRVYERKN